MKIDKGAYRQNRLELALDGFFEGNKAALGRALGYQDGSYIGQMIRGERPITEDTIEKIEALKSGLKGWFNLPPQKVHAVDNVYKIGQEQGFPHDAKDSASFTTLKRAPKLEWARLGENLLRANDSWPAEDTGPFTTNKPVSDFCKFVTVIDSRMQPTLLPGDSVLVDPMRVTPARDEIALFRAPDSTFFFARFRPLLVGFEAYDSSGHTQDSERHGITIAAVAVTVTRDL